MSLSAVQDAVLAQLPDPEPEAPPGSETSTALLRYLVWIHVAGTAVALAWCVSVARRSEGNRRRASIAAAGVLAVGLVTTLVGVMMGTALE
ncbi:hypothetical protein ACWDSJ_21245 [Nocardia sp. NPDC003482]